MAEQEARANALTEELAVREHALAEREQAVRHDSTHAGLLRALCRVLVHGTRRHAHACHVPATES